MVPERRIRGFCLGCDRSACYSGLRFSVYTENEAKWYHGLIPVFCTEGGVYFM